MLFREIHSHLKTVFVKFQWHAVIYQLCTLTMTNNCRKPERCNVNAIWWNCSCTSNWSFNIKLLLPSVVWRCWLGGRKGIRPVKNCKPVSHCCDASRCVLDVLQIIEASRQNKNDSAMVAGLPCYVALSWCHNHDIATAEALSYHSPAADLKETFMAYFNEGMNTVLLTVWWFH